MGCLESGKKLSLKYSRTNHTVIILGATANSDNQLWS